MSGLTVRVLPVYVLPVRVLRRSVAALAIAAPLALGAQDTLPVRAGARVRLRTGPAPDSAWRVGTLAAVRPETLLVRPCPRCEPDAFARDRVSAFEASVGRPNHAGAGLALGALAGAAVVVGKVGRCRDTGEGPPCAVGYLGLPVAVIAGAIGGTAIGGMIPAGPERWVPARPSATRRASAMQRPRAGGGWFGEPVPGARGGAQLGAVIGVPVGALAGARVPCHRTDGPPCQVDGMLVGAAVGAFAGSVLGAGTGAATVSHCPVGRSFARAVGGAALWSVPAAAYAALFRRGEAPPPEVTFVMAVSLPLLQAEGAARAASGACFGRRP